MNPRTATQTRKAKIQSRNAPLRTSVLSSLTRLTYFSSIDFAMALRNSLFVFVLPSRCRRSSVPSIWPTAESILRSRMTWRMTSGASSISSRRRDGEVVCAGETRDRVEQDHHVAVGLDESLGALERELGDAGVVLGRLVEGGREDLALDGPADIGDLFGALADEHDHDVDV